MIPNLCNDRYYGRMTLRRPHDPHLAIIHTVVQYCCCMQVCRLCCPFPHLPCYRPDQLAPLFIFTQHYYFEGQLTTCCFLRQKKMTPFPLTFHMHKETGVAGRPYFSSGNGTLSISASQDNRLIQGMQLSSLEEGNGESTNLDQWLRIITTAPLASAT